MKNKIYRPKRLVPWSFYSSAEVAAVKRADLMNLFVFVDCCDNNKPPEWGGVLLAPGLGFEPR